MSVVPLPLEMRAKSSRKASLVLGWIFLMAGSVITVFTGGVLALVGLFGLAFFGYGGLKLFRQRSDLAGLVLTPDGVRPLGWSATIPWPEITDIGVGKYSHNKLVGAASRREVGWDVIAMAVYLDRPVEQAAAILEAARQQQIRQPPMREQS